MVPGAALAATRRGTPLASSVDAAVIAEGCIRLAAAEPVFAGLLERHGQPPLWQRPATLGSLVQIILEQKVSLESARAVFDRVALLCPGLTPEALLAASPEALLEAGVSRRKISYCRSIAEALVSGDLQLEELAQLDSAAAEQRLIAIRGIGPWTAGVYTMMVLCRPDAWGEWRSCSGGVGAGVFRAGRSAGLSRTRRHGHCMEALARFGRAPALARLSASAPACRLKLRCR